MIKLIKILVTINGEKWRKRATVEKNENVYAPRVRAMAIIQHDNQVWAVTVGG